MCLIINNSVKVTFDENGQATVYKYLVGNKETGYGPPYYPANPRPGEMYVSNRTNKELAETEQNCGRVEHGLHFYLKSDDACNAMHNNGYGAVFAFQVHRDDLVATGVFSGDKSAVFMKAFFLDQPPLEEWEYVEDDDDDWDDDDWDDEDEDDDDDDYDDEDDF